MLKHYQQSNNEVDNKYSLNKHENTINQKGIFSKFRLLNSISKELKSRINDNIFLNKSVTDYADEDLPGDYSFETQTEKALNKIKRLELWEKENSLAMQKRLTLKLKDVQNNLNENEVFFMFTHYGFFIHQYCTTRDYQYDSFTQVNGYFKAKDRIVNAAKNPSMFLCNAINNSGVLIALKING